MIAISAGNHAQAVAYAAAEEGVDALVVMWQGASAAEDRRDARLRRRRRPRRDRARPGRSSGSIELLAETGRVLVHPHDDPLVIAGAGTVGLEIEEDAPDADVVIVAVGGGGLIAGIVAAIGDRMRIVAVEPELSRALRRGDRGRPSGAGRADGRSPTGSTRRSRARCRSSCAATSSACS